MSDAKAEIGFDGIGATVRKDRYVPPDQAIKELPKLVGVLAARKLDVTIMTTDVLGVDDPNSRRALKTAAALGIKCYRMGFYRYDLNRSINLAS